MTKEQKILLLFVLVVAASSATFYVSRENASSNNSNVVTNTAPSTSGSSALPFTQQPAPVAQQQPSSIGQPTTTSPNPLTPVIPVTPVAQDKTYAENITYRVPNDRSSGETIKVTVVLDSSNIVKDVLFAYNTPSNRQSSDYLGSFQDSFDKTALVGTQIGSVNLSRVGGASLTTRAFNKALAAVATQVGL